MEPADNPQLSRSTPLAHASPVASHGESQEVSRRAFLSIGGVLGATFALAACSSPRVARMPEPLWNDLGGGDRPAVPVSGNSTIAAGGVPRQPPVSTNAQSKPKPLGGRGPVDQPALAWAKPRSQWAKAAPDFADLNPMLPVTASTVHHDGLDDVIYTKDTASMAARIEHYRVGHRGRGWADIGYHLVIDRAGTLWQGRSIRYQGAHVKDHNEGNIGVLVMGNFERQQPTSEQLKTLERVLRDLSRTYKVNRRGVYTHREWPDAETACPGRNLQPKVASLRTRLA